MLRTSFEQMRFYWIPRSYSGIPGQFFGPSAFGASMNQPYWNPMTHTGVPNDYWPAAFEGDLTAKQKDALSYGAAGGAAALIAYRLGAGLIGSLTGASLGVMLASMIIKKKWPFGPSSV